MYVLHSDELLCLPSWHHGKQRTLSRKSHGILLSDFCGNPVLTYIALRHIWSLVIIANHALERSRNYAAGSRFSLGNCCYTFVMLRAYRMALNDVDGTLSKAAVNSG